jgi:hypothetical protein
MLQAKVRIHFSGFISCVAGLTNRGCRVENTDKDGHLATKLAGWQSLERSIGRGKAMT